VNILNLLHFADQEHCQDQANEKEAVKTGPEEMILTLWYQHLCLECALGVIVESQNCWLSMFGIHMTRHH